MRHICTIVTFGLLIAVFAFTQTAVVQRNVNLRPDPSTDHAPLSKLKPKARLRVVSPAEANGFLHVRTKAGLEGWVWSKNVAVKEATFSAATSSDAGCSTVRDLASCPDSGCTKDSHSGALKTPSAGIQTASHLKKLVIDSGTLRLLTLDDFDSLQTIAAQKVGVHRELDEQKRKPLSGRLAVAGGTVSEGDYVTVAGYVSDLRVNSGEAVSCYLSDERSNDYHINLTKEWHQTPFQGIVIEMIPQHREPSWESATIKSDLLGKNKMVRVTGRLFYDSGHSVNKDAAHPKGGQPQRFSLWEIHPVSTFEVCKNQGSCDPKGDSNWEAF